MKSSAVCVFFISVSVAQAASAQTNSWLCISDQSVGYSKATGSWAIARFNPGKYVIKASQTQGVAWEVRQFGNQQPTPDAICKETFNSSKFLRCTGVLTEFRFNAGTGRFMRIYSGGYWSYIPGDKWLGNDSEDTPVIEIGTCSEV